MNLCIRKVWVAININTAWIYTELCTALTVVYIKNINFKITLMPSNSMLSESLNGYNVYTLKRQIFPKKPKRKYKFSDLLMATRDGNKIYLTDLTGLTDVTQNIRVKLKCVTIRNK